MIFIYIHVHCNYSKLKQHSLHLHTSCYTNLYVCIYILTVTAQPFGTLLCCELYRFLLAVIVCPNSCFRWTNKKISELCGLSLYQQLLCQINNNWFKFTLRSSKLYMSFHIECFIYTNHNPSIQLTHSHTAKIQIQVLTVYI